MISIETVVYIGIVILGAMIVVVAAFLIIKSTSKKGITQIQTQPVENIETNAALKKRHATQNGVTDDRKISAIWKKKGDILRGIRALRKRITHPDQQPLDEGLAINDQFSIPLPDVTISEPEINTASSSPDQEVSNVEPTNGEETDVIMINNFHVEPANGEETEVIMINNFPVEPANEEETEVNMINNFPAESAESTRGWPQEELEPVEYKPEETDEAPDNEYQEQVKTKDDVFDLFTAEMVEESDVNKFAATLNNVDVYDLLKEAQSLTNRLRGAPG